MKEKRLFQNNPFAKFAAGSPTNTTGWLTTKKRGRDDEQIKRDKQTAQLNRRNRQNKKKSNNNNKKKKNNHSSDDDDESDDDFLVELGSENEEGSSSSSESEIEEEEEDEISESDSEIAENGFNNNNKKRKPMNNNTNKNNNKKKKKEDSDSDDDFLAEGMDHEVTFHGIKRKSNKVETILSSSSDDDDEQSTEFSHLQKPKSIVKSKKQNKSIILDSSSEDDDEEDFADPFLVKSSLEGGDDITSNKKKKKKTNSFLVDTDSEEEDIDEAIALSIALKESKETHEKEEKREKMKQLQKKRLQSQKTNHKKKTKKKQGMNRYIRIDDDDYENDQVKSDNDSVQDDEEQEEYVSKDKKEASKVLEAATNLSDNIRKIIKTSWPVDDTKDIASDGALAASSIISCSAEEKKEEISLTREQQQYSYWITNDEMRTVCPDVTLKEYQLIGVNWMALLHRMTFDVKTSNSRSSKRKRGTRVNGVLADGMGLGKTVQTIAFLAWLKHQNDSSKQEEGEHFKGGNTHYSGSIENETLFSNKPHLIIVPASVLSNWQREFETFCPEMNVVKYHGTMDERQTIKRNLSQFLPSDKGLGQKNTETSLDVVLTTYSYFSSEKSDDRSFLRKFQWNYMVVDEAHCLKNPSGLRYRNMDNFETERRLLLTGTPVQNSPQELMSLLCFLMPLFQQQSTMDEDDARNGGNHMLEYFVRLESANGKGDGISAKNGKGSEENAYRKLKQLFSPFVLRRTKNIVLQQMMPPKTRRVEWVSFDDKSKKIYDNILSSHIEGKKTNTKSAKKHLFTVLRKASNHQLLLRTRHTSASDIEHLSDILFTNGYFGFHESCTQKLVKKELENFSDYDIHCAALSLIEDNCVLASELSRYTLNQEDIFSSPKCVQLKALLPQLISEGHRMLIFSQWTRCLDLLDCLLETMNLKFLRLDGSTSVSDRQSLIDEFNENMNIPVFLLSTRAGGMGINLTAADTCILHDLDFNPFNDLQAEDRCHRIGQTKPVTIIKLVAKDTVETDIYRMQERKALMNDAILGKAKSTKTAESQEINGIMELTMKRFEASK